MDKRIELIKEWTHKAKNDIGIAKLALDSNAEYTDAICFHCQQAVEKYLKAYLINQDILFKKTHSLPYLLDLIDETDKVSEEMYQKAEVLESYAVEIRYPNDWYEPTMEDAHQAYEIALEFQRFICEKLHIG